ncbi:hypothetical protein NA57DRAFT_69890 [Rhizodiscina lignyota]|uniref:MYND-type domain-containing protein n=1 Tax=Rhizodiscina lignyota TaxID=1504668 RepID=A0A9P4MDQ0_9PEZI|nr:hypothetical protein NA57DRAFT_69890 [Rhizodiscina lignyota]
MGAWGYGLFQSDPDLDHADQLSEVAGVDLLHPENPAKVRRTLDKGVLAKTFDRYLADKPLQKYSIVLLGALAMMLGAKINAKYMNVLRGMYNDTELFPQSKKQFKSGLDSYRNDGTPWDLQCPGVGDVVNDPNSDAMRESEASGSILINVGGIFEPMRAPGPRAPRTGASTTELSYEPRCWKCTEVKEKLLVCIKCKRAAYCGKDCQKGDWKHHKKFCVAAESKN